MGLRIQIASRAAGQIWNAATWWTQNRLAAPGALTADFGEALALLAKQPGIGARYQGSRTPGVRRLFLSRIGYFIYYKTDSETLEVLAFWHANREKAPVL